MRILAALLLLSLITFFGFPTAVHGQAEAQSDAGTWLPLNANIAGMETWDASHSPYVIHGTLAINGSLEIGPGVVVKLAPAAGIQVTNGSIRATGTEAAPVIFTSLADDAAGGDTNADGETSDPDQDRWGSISISDNSSASFSNARFSYAGSGWTYARCGGDSGGQCASAQFSGVLIQSGGVMNVSDSSFDWTPGSDLAVFGGTFNGDHIVFGPSYDMVHAEQTYEGPQPEVTIRNSSIDKRISYDSPIWVNLGSPILHLDHDWWGSADGPANALTTRGNFWNPVSPILSTDDWLTSPDLYAPESGSSVLFLPGIEASRLYDGSGKLWEPFDLAQDGVFSLLSGDASARMRALMLDSNGGSAGGIFAKEGDVLDATGGADYYRSFEESLDRLRSASAIADWKPIAYDWRFSPEWIVSHGVLEDGKVFYENASGMPYIEQELMALAAGSKTGKVTIVAHSYGGLVAKALMEKLGPETAKIIDKVVLVGVPQTGSPSAIGGLLFGQGEGISAFHGLLQIVSPGIARESADTLPAAYDLLPSSAYFASADDPEHPVVSFADRTLFAAQYAAYGARISTWDALASFLADENGRRTTPALSDTRNAAILPHPLLDGASATHSALDPWTPPRGISVYQIAGWGDEATPAGIEFYGATKLGGLLGYAPAYRPITTEDGDGLVTVPSALFIGEASSSRYWLNLAAYAKDTGKAAAHGDELSIPELQELVANIITNDPSVPRYLTKTAPDPINRGAQLRFTLRGNGSLNVSDDSGRTTGIGEDGKVTISIPDSFFGSLGDLMYVLLPELGTYRVSVLGADADAALTEDTVEDGTVTGSTPIDPSSTATVTDGEVSQPSTDQSTDDPGITDTDGSGSPPAPTDPQPNDESAGNAPVPYVPPSYTPPAYSDTGSTGGGFVSASVTIQKPATVKAVKAPKPKTTAKPKTATSTAKKKTATQTPAPVPLPVSAATADVIRAAISTMLAEIFTLVSALAQLLTSLLTLS